MVTFVTGRGSCVAVFWLASLSDLCCLHSGMRWRRAIVWGLAHHFPLEESDTSIFLAWMLFYSAPMFLGLSFPKLDMLMGGKISNKYMSTVALSILGLIVLLRGLEMRRLAQADVEQIAQPGHGRPLFK